MSLASRVAALERVFAPPVEPVRFVLAAAPPGLSYAEHREWSRRLHEEAAAEGRVVHTLNIEELPIRSPDASDGEDGAWWADPRLGC